MKIIIASNNQGKVREFKQLLEPLGYEPISMKEAGCELDIVEDGDTFEENAHIKARTVHECTGLPVIADDSGLEVDFLDGAPGVYSARYAGEDASDIDRCRKVLDELANVDLPLRSARFVCAIYFIKDENEEYCVTGTVDGFIGEDLVGDNGFGYDPIFMVDEDTSMAQLSDVEKNKISHRSKALHALLERLKEK